MLSTNNKSPPTKSRIPSASFQPHHRSTGIDWAAYENNLRSGIQKNTRGTVEDIATLVARIVCWRGEKTRKTTESALTSRMPGQLGVFIQIGARLSSNPYRGQNKCFN